MTFEEAAGRYAELRTQLQDGRLDFADFQAAVARLTVVDPNGEWWQIDPASGEWLRWNGSAWVRPGAPEEPKPEPPPEAPKREYSLLMQTQDYRTALKPGAEDALWVYASVACSDAAVDCSGLAGGIQFQAGGANAAWLALSPPAPVAGAVAVLVTAAAPDPSAVLLPGGATILASAAIEGQSLSAEVPLDIAGPSPAELAPLVWATQPDPREHKGASLARRELLADGEDQLEVAVMYLPADLVTEGADPAALAGQASALVRLKQAGLTGPGRENLAVEGAPSDTPGVFKLRVRSRRPLLATVENAAVDVALEIEGELAAEAAGRYRLRETPARLAIRCKFFFLKLIVVPAARQGASQAIAYVGTAPGTPQPLKDVACQLDLVSFGSGPSLVLRDDPAKRTAPSGLVSWTLEYKGASWNNVGEARFKVRAGVKGLEGAPLEATWVEIDVNANGQGYLSALGAAAPELGLNNPSFQGRGGILAQMWPDSLAGPLNDVCSLAAETDNWRHYTSPQMRDRMWRFALERRFSSDLNLASAMNGLEFARYEIAPIHACCALTLAGNDEPYFVDPWWEQVYHPDRSVVSEGPVKDRLEAGLVLLETVGAAVLVKMGAAGSAAVGEKAIRDWLACGLTGSPVEVGENAAAVGRHRFRIGKVALAREPWLNADGSYKEAPAGWGESFFEGPGSEALRTGIVSPLEGWQEIGR